MSGYRLTQKNRSEILRLALEDLKKRNGDLKANVVANQVIQNGANENDLVATLDHYFVRHFSRDISNVELVESNIHQPFIELQLTKAGFYDLLPEGLFFQPTQKDFAKGNQINVAEEVFNYRRDKQREKEIRKFFQPIENEIFKQEIYIEKHESELIDFFRTPQTEIWNFPASISEKDQTSFALLLPHALEINGNLALMTTALELILKEKIHIRKQKVEASHFPQPLTLGSSRLGSDMICGDVFWEESLILHYEIGPLQRHSIEDFLPGGNALTLFKTFNRFFAPLDADLEFEIMIDRDKQKATLAAGEDSILGYSTIL
ncbi:MAG: hypothetical protein DI598_04095 [Pseudopedobacter saltans]|uniref:Type VI secretion system baseplate subunit TssG n=1 Tax=Pseudopedobacter saltans TaxID=151895 RepID=A0A2W5HBP8_9SPHI|nr:MAG: hypothetical protein DI598_04095 [Pseudopedobacter saltans]